MWYRIRSHLLIAAIITAFAALPWPKPAFAQDSTGPPRCGDRTHMSTTLLSVFGERLVAQGLSKSGLLTEIYAGPRGTWSIVATTPTGISCLVDNGVAWMTVSPPLSH